MKNALALGIFVFAVLIVLAIETVTRFWQRLLLILAAFAILVASVYAARARDLGQWGNADQHIVIWFQSLMQPDNPAVSCCGEADAYWADEMHVRDGKTYAVVTDERDDAPLKRKHIPIGTEIEVPNYKLKYDQGNPTGHGVLFLSASNYPYCFVMPGGV